MINESNNPYDPPKKSFSVNFLRVFGWLKNRKRRKLRARLEANRQRRRQALHFKEDDGRDRQGHG